MILLLYVEKRI